MQECRTCPEHESTLNGRLKLINAMKDGLNAPNNHIFLSFTDTTVFLIHPEVTYSS